MIEYSENNEYSSPSSRYRILRKITDIETNTSYLETQNQREIPVTSNDSYYMVGQSEVNRLDIVAYKCYNDPAMWWAIALANDIVDPFSVPKGKLLRIPSITSLYSVKNKILAR